MEEDQIKLTYETLFEILRIEKNKGELQKLDNAFFTDLSHYLLEKSEIMQKDNEQSKLFGEQEKLKTLNELANIKKIIKELYEKREKKIIELVLNKSRTNSNLITNTNLLPEENPLYESLLKTMNEFRSKILHNILDVNRTKALKTKNEVKINNILIKFKVEVPQFVGKELETYGPFKPEDISSIPIEIANILINKGQAEKIQIQE